MVSPHPTKVRIVKIIIFPVAIYGLPCGSDSKASTYNAGDLGLIPELGRSPGKGNGHTYQYSCLENPMDGEGWQATVHGLQRFGQMIEQLTHTQTP